MLVYGVDFTSAPSRSKAITCAGAALDGHALRVRGVERLPSMEALRAFLQRPGPWIAGFDFPFSQPRRLIEALGWPTEWGAFVAQMATLEMADFVERLKRYRDRQPAGDKQHRRRTDVRADSRSPMMLYGVPVGRMFLRGAPALLQAELSIVPCQPTQSDRVAIEAYPRLVANKVIGPRRSYKNDDRRKQTPDMRAAREAIVRALPTPAVAVPYDLSVDLASGLAETLTNDASGDSLDAVLCAIQAAWAYNRRDFGYGIPGDCDPLEGWIVDPGILEW